MEGREDIEGSRRHRGVTRRGGIHKTWRGRQNTGESTRRGCQDIKGSTRSGVYNLETSTRPNSRQGMGVNKKMGDSQDMGVDEMCRSQGRGGSTIRGDQYGIGGR